MSNLQFDFEIKIAQTPQEIEAAQRLRYDIFCLEDSDGRGPRQGRGLDIDKYDAASKHLIVIDKNKNRIVGTYRLLFGSDAGSVGFHAEEIFNIKKIKEIPGNLLELGRSCVHQEYRNSSVINLLWNGIAWQVKERSIDYIFGCPRIDLMDPIEVSEAFRFLQDRYYADEAFRTFPLPKNIFKGFDDTATYSNPRLTFRKLSPLIKGYLYIGARVCGPPAINSEFGSVVFFMLLPTDKIAASYRRHFLDNKTH